MATNGFFMKTGDQESGPDPVFEGRKKMIEEIAKDYKLKFAGFKKDGKIQILFASIEEEKRFQEEYSSCLDFIEVIKSGTIKVSYIPVPDGLLDDLD